MPAVSLRTSLLTIGLGLAASGCSTYGPYGYAYGGLSVGSGYGYDGGYGGYGGYGYDPYSYGYGGGYSPYGYGYPASSYYGWYGDFYYPGTGYYVYDRYRQARRWNDRERDYWSHRRSSQSTGNFTPRANWGGFGRNRDGVSVTNQSVSQQQVRQQEVRREQVRQQSEQRGQSRSEPTTSGELRRSGWHFGRGNRQN